MTLSAEEHNIDQHADSLADYLPNGPLFEAKKIGGSNFRKVLRGFATELKRAEGYIKTFDEEYSPLNTVLFISEWESAVGIPDECFSGTGSIDERRSHVLTKLAALGVQTAGDIVDLGSILGVAISVESLDDMLSPPIPVVFPQARFTVVVSGAGITTDLPPYDVPFTPGSNDTILQCAIRRIIPVNCSLIFVNN